MTPRTIKAARFAERWRERDRRVNYLHLLYLRYYPGARRSRRRRSTSKLREAHGSYDY